MKFIQSPSGIGDLSQFWLSWVRRVLNMLTKICIKLYCFPVFWLNIPDDVCHRRYLMTFVTEDTWWRLSQKIHDDVCHRTYLMTFVTEHTWWRLSQKIPDDICHRTYLMTFVTEHTWWRLSQKIPDDVCHRRYLMTFVTEHTWWRLSQKIPDYVCHRSTPYALNFMSTDLIFRWHLC
jgi:hypothetical protein